MSCIFSFLDNQDSYGRTILIYSWALLFLIMEMKPHMTDYLHSPYNTTSLPYTTLYLPLSRFISRYHGLFPGITVYLPVSRFISRYHGLSLFHIRRFISLPYTSVYLPSIYVGLSPFRVRRFISLLCCRSVSGIKLQAVYTELFHLSCRCGFVVCFRESGWGYNCLCVGVLLVGLFLCNRMWTDNGGLLHLALSDCLHSIF